MSVLEKFKRSLCAASLALIPFAPAALAQDAVLTGSVHQNDYRPQIVTQDAYVTQVPVTSPASSAYAGAATMNTMQIPPVTSVRPVTSGRISSGRPAQCRVQYVDRPVTKTVYVQDNRTFFQKHPKVKAVTIGAGVGAGVGAVTGLVTHRGVVRGALIGGGAGAGVGLVRSSEVMKRHPIMRNVATGSLVGLGIGAAASRGHRKALMGTGIGAAVGLGASLLNGEFR